MWAIPAMMVEHTLKLSRNVATRLKDVIVPLYSAFMRLYMEYGIWLGALWYKRDVKELGRAYRKAAQMVREPGHTAQKGPLNKMGLSSLEIRRVKGL